MTKVFKNVNCFFRHLISSRNFIEARPRNFIDKSLKYMYIFIMILF